MNLVIGKFYPPHLGHHWLIDQALNDGDTIVAIMWSETEHISPGLRKRWIRDEHRYLNFALVNDELPVDFQDKELSFQHAALVKREIGPYLGTDKITKVFGSEPYVPHLAEYFDAEPVVFDRTDMSFSATMFREDPRKRWDMLLPSARAGLCKRVVCIGAESTGTTTLAKDLAKRYRTVWVPEYGRLYCEGLRPEHFWEHQDFVHIEMSQRHLENQMAHLSRNGLLICDTNGLATRMWELFLSETNHRLIPPGSADLFILTDLCPWVDDGTRLGEDLQVDMHNLFQEHLAAGEDNWIQVTGSPEERVEQAAAAIDRLTWDFTPRVL